MTDAAPPALEIIRATEEEARALPPIPSLLSRDERVLYRHVGRRHHSGRGLVLELGTWLGSGTAELCRGLDESGAPWRLTAVDRFAWVDAHRKKVPEAGLAIGDSFMPLFLRNLAPWGDRVDAVQGDLANLADLVPMEGELELLVVDAPKTWRLMRRILDHVGPRLMPGARVVFQDFFHLTSRQLIWLAMMVPEFRLTTIVGDGTTAVFEASGPLGDLPTLPRSFNAFDVAMLQGLWDRARRELPASRMGSVGVGMALDLMDRSAFGPAEAVLSSLDREGPDWAVTASHIAQLGKHDSDEGRKLRSIGAFLASGRPLADEAPPAAAKATHPA